MTIFDWQTEAGYESTGDLTPEYMEKFKARARDWANQVVELQSTATSTQALTDKKAALLKWAGVIRKGIESITGTLDGLNTVGLGVIPLVPIAVITASVAAMTKWIADYATFKDAMALQKDLVAGGTAPQKATEMVTSILKNKPIVSLKSGSIGVVTLIGGYLAAKSLGWIK